MDQIGIVVRDSSLLLPNIVHPHHLKLYIIVVGTIDFLSELFLSKLEHTYNLSVDYSYQLYINIEEMLFLSLWFNFNTIILICETFQQQHR